MATFRTLEDDVPTPGARKRDGIPSEARPHPEKFRPGRAFRIANRFMTTLLRAGVPAGSNYLLTVPGRKSGLPRTTPVTVVEYEGDRWVTSPYGEVDWVRNLRAAGEATIRRGRRADLFRAQEVSAVESAPLLKWMLNEVKMPSIVRKQYLVSPDAPLASYEREARYHPVFRLTAEPVV